MLQEHCIKKDLQFEATVWVLNPRPTKEVTVTPLQFFPKTQKDYAKSF